MTKKTLTPEQYRKRMANRRLILNFVGCPDCAATIGERCYRSDRGGKRRKAPHRDLSNEQPDPKENPNG